MSTVNQTLPRAKITVCRMIIGMRDSMRGETTSMLGAESDQASVFTPVEAQYNPFGETGVRSC